ncbi:hypothetical protein BpHYR1_023291 [Brachionus plicatilis]|uniref:Uncharacterized protein n=1 Tax=Brachionus plicatilis TaxID=10195 RepID=A0A3M7QR16_BRAPC|nr:hypothetical protein BpHYR1_023291 [Brachionus plicatilis]
MILNLIFLYLNGSYQTVLIKLNLIATTKQIEWLDNKLIWLLHIKKLYAEKEIQEKINKIIFIYLFLNYNKKTIKILICGHLLKKRFLVIFFCGFLNKIGQVHKIIFFCARHFVVYSFNFQQFKTLPFI